MECDSVHSLLERKLRNREIHLPSEYAKVTKECKIYPKPYIVKVLQRNLFKNYAESKYLRYASKKAFDPVIADIKCIKYDYEPFPNIQVKVSYDEPFIDIPIRPKSLPVIEEYPQFLKDRCKIKKWDHLQELKSVLPTDTHAFYDNLIY
nr:unnamed protein product [Callosobruchus chinensis]